MLPRAKHTHYHYNHYYYHKKKGWGCSSVGRASNRHAVNAGSIPRCGIFFSRSQLSVRTLLGIHTSSCTIAYIYTCAHVKDPVVHVRVRWIMETLEHPACTLGWVARLCCSWLSPGKATRIFHGRNPVGTIQLLKKKKKVKKVKRKILHSVLKVNRRSVHTGKGRCSWSLNIYDLLTRQHRESKSVIQFP